MYITIKIYKDIYEDKDIPRDMSGIIKLFIFGMSYLTHWLIQNMSSIGKRYITECGTQLI